jgi:peptidoglycan hydrolase-like protein with peptidoglycan-binding domain
VQAGRVPSGLARILALLGAAAVVVVATPPEPARAGSSDVAALQVAMSAHGLYPHPVDGITGPWTISAVRTFQRRNGLRADGVAGPKTRAALGSRGRPDLGSRPLKAGKNGWDVSALQFLLHSRGFGPGGFDGGFGPNTSSAVRRFQSAAGIAADGVAGPQTLAALLSGTSTSVPSDPVRFLRPVGGPMGDGFGYFAGRRHTGIDFPEAMGTPVGASGRGVVSFAGWNNGGYGNLVVVTHRLGFESWYAHLSEVATSPGAAVSGGVVIGYVGSTGRSTGPHLHWEVRQFGTPIDPLPRLLAARSAGAASAKAAGKRARKQRCRANADARAGRDADPYRARLDRCPK